MTGAVDADGLTAEWLTAALGREVRSVTCARVGAGQTAATYRLVLDGDDGPASLVAKVAHGDDEARRRVATGFRAEVGFYAELAATLDVRIPWCPHAAISADGLRFTVLLEDLAPRRPGVQAAGCSVRQARQATLNLAGLHAPRWNDLALLDLGFLPRMTAERASFLAATAMAATAVFVERYADELSTRELETLRTAAAAVETWLVARPQPFAPVHGDYRLDNLMFAPDGTDVVAVDWQTLTIGPPLRDVAYLLGTSLKTEDRRRSEEQLVGDYYDALVDRGIRGYPRDRCYDDYRLGQLLAPMITTIGAAYATAGRTAAADAMFLAMARRSCAAIRDLATLDLL